MTCSICLDQLSLYPKADTECGHVFHTKCLMENLSVGTKGFTCPMCRTPLCSEKDVELKRTVDLLENNMYKLQDNMVQLENTVVYLYHRAEFFKLMECNSKSEVRHLHKKTAKLQKNLKYVQGSLSKSLVDLAILEDRPHSVKCSRCNFRGHNSKTCQIKPKKIKQEVPFLEYTETSGPTNEEIIDDAFDGEMSELVEDYFYDDASTVESI